MEKRIKVAEEQSDYGKRALKRIKVAVGERIKADSWSKNSRARLLVNTDADEEKPHENPEGPPFPDFEEPEEDSGKKGQIFNIWPSGNMVKDMKTGKARRSFLEFIASFAGLTLAISAFISGAFTLPPLTTKGMEATLRTMTGLPSCTETSRTTRRSGAIFIEKLTGWGVQGGGCRHEKPEKDRKTHENPGKPRKTHNCPTTCCMS